MKVSTWLICTETSLVPSATRSSTSSYFAASFSADSVIEPIQPWSAAGAEKPMTTLSPASSLEPAGAAERAAAAVVVVVAGVVAGAGGERERREAGDQAGREPLPGRMVVDRRDMVVLLGSLLERCGAEVVVQWWCS